jgi:glycosyltransferase involved in cell wall biosynthesis
MSCSENQMDKRPVVSIVTVTFNSADTLTDTINSVLGQAYDNFEHVIVDGGSTDGTIQLIQKFEIQYRGRLKWTSGPDGGIYDAMNKGVALATGDIVGILNSDDLYVDANVLTDIVSSFAENDCDFLYADLIYVDRADLDVTTRVWAAGDGRFALGWNPPHPTLYLRRSVYEQNGWYKTDYKISSDYDYMIRLFNPKANLRPWYLRRTIVKMRQGGESTKSLRSNIIAFREAQQSLESYQVRMPWVVNALRVLRKLRQLRARRTADGPLERHVISSVD